jgi:hypothetical protein
MTETIRESIDRARTEVGTTDRPPPYMADVQERSNLREDIARAVQSPGKSNPTIPAKAGYENPKAFRREESGHGLAPHLQQYLDDNRRLAGEAMAWNSKRDKLRASRQDPSAIPPPIRDQHGRMSVRDSIYAALEEVKLPKQVFTSVDPLAGAVKTDIARTPQTPDYVPAHWDGVSQQEFRSSVPLEVRQTAHQHTEVVSSFHGWRQHFGNPKTAGAAFENVFTRYPLSEIDRQALYKWSRDPNRHAPQRPAFNFTLPKGWTQDQWSATTPAIRRAVRQEAEMAFMATEFDKLLADPGKRLEAAKHLYSTFTTIENHYSGQMAQHMPQEHQIRTAAEHTVTTWSRDKPHYGTLIPNGQGGTLRVRELMGHMIQHDWACVQGGQPQAFGTVTQNGQPNFDHAYNTVVKAAGLKPPRAQRRQSTSMRGGAPDGPAAGSPKDWEPQRGDSTRASIAKALMELRG